ncbi:hypothetical protein LPB67_12420 [Undibacterium sp. Jales W-56]|uniref:hypothetical protein n=1 Tax=Undibacterium sp. Jales W-56 TaxID=2897325 RepID=UPI0021CEE3FC|nr:hypothetical protein [Undibacterium sp. Jales W-56]MCU6434576.1 hypothetical protein [Undibacterium sp. Jales W-56]
MKFADLLPQTRKLSARDNRVIRKAINCLPAFRLNPQAGCGFRQHFVPTGAPGLRVGFENDHPYRQFFLPFHAVSVAR